MRAPPRALPLGGALAVAISLAGGPAAGEPEEQRAILDLTVNEVPKGAVNVVIRAGDVSIQVSDLEAAGLHDLGGRRTTREGATWVALSSLAPELRFALDEENLRLKLDAVPRLLATHVVNLRARKPQDI